MTTPTAPDQGTDETEASAHVVRLRALSMWQPWASLVTLRAKRVETRPALTSYRGPLAIHATKGVPAEYRKRVESYFHSAPFRDVFYPLGIFHLEQLPHGGIIGLAVVDTAARIGPLLRATIAAEHGERELAFGDYRDNRAAISLRDARPVPHPSMTPELAANMKEQGVGPDEAPPRFHVIPCRGQQAPMIWDVPPDVGFQVADAFRRWTPDLVPEYRRALYGWSR